MDRWHDYNLRSLFALIKSEMPPLRFRTPEARPLADDTYVDIIAYILKANGFPAGKIDFDSRQTAYGSDRWEERRRASSELCARFVPRLSRARRARTLDI